MRRLLHITSVCFLLIGFTNCSDCVVGDGSRVKEYRNPGTFTAVHSDIVGRVQVEADSTLTEDEVIIEAQENIAENIETSVSHGVLTISFIECMEEHKDIIITASAARLSSVQVIELGRIETKSKITADSFHVATTGNGKADLVLQTRSVSAEMKGSGDITLHGETGNLYVESSGPGSVRTYEFPARNAYVKNTDAGNCYLRVNRFLDAEITGHGSVFYIGAPVTNRTGDGDGELNNEN